MDQLINFVLQQLKSLPPFAYLVIFLASVIVGFAEFLILRWLYVSRYGAQEDLLHVKE